MTALGALINCTKPPATPGPPIEITASLIESLLLASTNCVLSTKAGNTAIDAIWKKTVSVPTRKVTIQSCSKVI